MRGQYSLARILGIWALVAIPMGILVDRSTRVRLLLAAVVLWCGSLFLIGLSHDVWLLALAKGIMGLALALTYPAAMSLMADYFPPAKRAFPSVTFGMGQDVGAGVGMLVGGVGFSALVALVASSPQALGGLSPWRAVSLIFAGCGVLLIPAVAMLREPPRMERQASGSGSLIALWHFRSLLIPILIGMMALGGLVSGLRTWFAPALMRLYKLQPGDFALWLSLIMLIGGFTGHALSSRLVTLAHAQGGDRKAMLLATVAAVICVPSCFLAMTSAVWGFAILMTVFAIASGIAVAIPVIILNVRLPNELRGLSMGLYVVLLSISGMMGAPLIGYVSQQLGGDQMLGQAMAVVGAPFAALAAISFVFATRESVTERERRFAAAHQVSTQGI